MNSKTQTLNMELVRQAASQFLESSLPLSIELLGQGLIHQTYKVTDGGDAIVLQAINRSVFKNPEDIVSNYFLVFEFLKTHNTKASIPAPVKTKSGETFFIDPGKEFLACNGICSRILFPIHCQ